MAGRFATAVLLVTVCSVAVLNAGVQNSSATTEPTDTCQSTNGVDDCPDPTVMAQGWTQAEQDLLSPYADDIANRLTTDPNYGIVSLDYQNSAVKVYYAGFMPSSLDSIITAAQQDGVGGSSQSGV